MRPEEARALFDGLPAPGGGARAARVRRALLVGALAIAASAAVAFGIAHARAAKRADLARADLERALRERDAASGARDESLALAVAVERDAAERLRAAADRVEAALARASAAERAASDASAAASILRGVLRGATAGAPEGARPPALHELLRGETLSTLAAALPEREALELRRIAVRAMALEPTSRSRAAARADLEIAKDFLDAAQGSLASDETDLAQSELAEAHLAVALLSVRYASLPAFEEAARAAVRANATACAARAEEIFARLGVARGRALSLDVLGQVATAEGRRAEAAARFAAAREAFGPDAPALDVAPIERRLAISTYELGRREEAMALLRASADRARAASPFVSDAELEARRLLVAMVSATDATDATAAAAERIEVGRVLVQLGRHAAAIEPLSEAMRVFAADETRFRERLEAAVWIARAMDALGSTEAAVRTLEETRIVADARTFGAETMLAKEYAALRTRLRAKLEAQRGGG